jgi:hypothetical protein
MCVFAQEIVSEDIVLNFMLSVSHVKSFYETCSILGLVIAICNVNSLDKVECNFFQSLFSFFSHHLYYFVISLSFFISLGLLDCSSLLFVT